MATPPPHYVPRCLQKTGLELPPARFGFQMMLAGYGVGLAGAATFFFGLPRSTITRAPR